MKNSAFQLCSSNEIESSSFAVVVVLVGQLSNSKILLFSTVRIFIEFVTSFFFFKNPTPTTRETLFKERYETPRANHNLSLCRAQNSPLDEREKPQT